MTKFTKGIRPAMLSSAAARKALDHLNVEEFEYTFKTIDQLSEVWSSLSILRETADSRLTREARALAYRDQHRKAQEHAGTLLRVATERLEARRNTLRNDAFKRAGLLEQYPQAEEVRKALRELSQAERDSAISEAIDRGDAWIIASIRNFPPLLTGKLTMSREMIEDLFVDRAAPELREQMTEIDTALQSLDFAASSFNAATEEMRDIEAEDKANADAAKVAEAEAAFSKAIAQLN